MLVVAEPVLDYFIVLVLRLGLRFVEFGTKVHSAVLWLIEVFDHVDGLTTDVECLLDILLDELDQRSAEVLLHLVDMHLCQRQHFHIADTLHCEGSLRQYTLIEVPFNIFMLDRVFSKVLHQEYMVYHSVFKPHVLQYFLVTFFRMPAVVIFLSSLRINYGYDLVVIAGLHEGSESLCRDHQR
jgi:hypothetical protein